LGNLARFIDYRGKTPKKVDSGIPLITAKNVRFGYINREPYEYLTESEYESWMTRGFPRVGDILFTTEAPLGNVAIIDIQERFALAQRVICLQLHKPEIACFLKFLIMSAIFQNQLLDNATGMTATGIKSSRLKEIPIPIPPLAEQRRIVAKIDELMARCDELEKLRGNRDRKQITVHTATLNRFIIAKEQSEFNTAWQFITQHFSELYSVKENVTELRKAILQLAVMGKLVPQDPSDQPASELLKDIEEEKEKLVQEGKIKKSKPLPEIKPEEIPYEVPKSWKWVRLGDISLFSDSGWSPHVYRMPRSGQEWAYLK
jgi:type I restriction enzyme S subunit